MKARTIRDGVEWMGAVDWDRRLFDALIPLPDGTSYNAYLVRGSEKTALIDTVDPPMRAVLFRQLESVPRVDYVVSHHGEQDHSGCIPDVLAKYPGATVLATPKGRATLVDLLGIPDGRIASVQDGETVSLGGKTLEFIYTPWVHWPETMVTYLHGDKVLFSCDFFGSHLATSDLYATDEERVYEAAKRYFAEIMMPYRKVIQKNLEKVRGRHIDLICPSHGPVYDRPRFIQEAYQEWVSDKPRNVVVVPYVSMHGSTAKMVDRLVDALVQRGITCYRFDLSVVDLGKLAATLVDAATLVVGTPAVNAGPHPLVIYAASLVNMLRPKLKFVSVLGSYAWSSKAVESVGGLLPDLHVEVIPPVFCKGLPRPADLEAIDRVAGTVAEKHKGLGLS